MSSLVRTVVSLLSSYPRYPSGSVSFTRLPSLRPTLTVLSPRPTPYRFEGEVRDGLRKIGERRGTSEPRGGLVRRRGCGVGGGTGEGTSPQTKEVWGRITTGVTGVSTGSHSDGETAVGRELD